MKQIGFKPYYFLFIYYFFFKHFVNGVCVPPKFSAIDGSTTTCLDSVEVCKDKGYYYYNSYELKCWKDKCPDDYKTNEMNSQNKPSEDLSKNTCVKQCGQNFPKYRNNENICLKNCATGEGYTIDEPNLCKSVSDINKIIYPYVSEKDLNLYIKECHFEKFIYTDKNRNNQKICVSNCKEYNQFFATGNQNCLEKCETNTHPYYNIYKQCLELCLYNNDTTSRYSPQKTNNPQQCKSSYNTNTECYYESNKIIYNINAHTFFKNGNINICLLGCNGSIIDILGKSGKYYCISNCNSYTYRESVPISGIYYTKCVNSCTYHIKGSIQCISECPTNYAGFTINGENVCIDPNCKKSEKFDTVAKECKTKSSTLGPKYIYQEVGDFNKKNTFVWVSSCTNEKPFIKDENDPECVSSCPQDYEYLSGTSPNIKCLKSCTTKFSIDSENYSGKYECTDICPETQYVLVDEISGTEKCSKNENFNFNYIRLNEDANRRFRSCPSDNKYYKIDGTKIYCKGNTNPCTSGTYYFEGECFNYAGCYSKNQIYIDKEDKTCADKCKSGKDFKNKDGNIYICQANCNGMFIDSGNYCISECPKGKNFIGKDNYCKSKCDNNIADEKYYYVNKTKTDYIIYKCTKLCNENNYNYYGYNTTECFISCPSSLKYKSEREKKCYSNCLQSPTYNFTIGQECFDKCNSANKFYYESEKICSSGCQNGDYAYSNNNNSTFECVRDCALTPHKFFYKNDTKQTFNICVNECWGDKPFYNGSYCQSQCPDEKRFFIKTKTKHIECLTDCPNDNKYYTIYDEGDREKLYGCSSTQCSKFSVVNETDKNLNAILCIDGCPETGKKYSSLYKDYKYYISNKCYTICPDSNPLHYEDEYECIKKCIKTEKEYLEIGGSICKNEKKCLNKYIDFENKACLSKDLNQCPSDKTYSAQIGEGKIMCSNSCSYDIYTKSTPYHTCVSDCNQVSMIANDTNYFNSKCTCRNLYYINNSINVQCISSSEIAKCKEVSDIYRINVYDERIGSKECIQTCNDSRVLSLKEIYCYDKSYTCNKGEDQHNTQEITKNNGQRQCDCKFRFYYYEETIYNNKKLKLKECLNDGVKCHSVSKNKYVPETKECADVCPKDFNHEFQNYFCLKDCPKDSVQEKVGDIFICKCVPPKKYWHKISSGNFECLDTCHDKYPVYAPYNNRCLKQCKGSYFPVFHENKCYRSCNGDKGDPTPNIVNGKLTDEDGGDLYAKTCKCNLSYTWYKHENNTIFCSNQKTDCKSFVNPTRKFKYKIYDTNQCVDECPDEYPYIFNEGCFKNCSHAAQIYNFTNYSGIFECQCTNLWINKTNGDVYIKECIDPNLKECYNYSSSLIYKINTTKECVEKCPDEMYEINYTCYENCPEYTKDNERDKKCSCNTNMGYWYEFQREYDGNDLSFLECGVDKCPYDIYDKSQKENPDTRQYLLKSDKKCLNNCNDNDKYKYNYKNICIKECPYYTYTEHENNCTLFRLNDTKIKNREELKGATEVQALELYYNLTKTINEYKDEFFYNERFDVAIHIYGIDRKNSYKDMVDFTSNKYNGLTYIDFGTCINKLFLDKNISEDEQILLVKYDILNETSYLINRVEYGLFSNNTNEKLDALVCDPYEILVSYPLFLERFNDMVGTDNNNEYLEKFNIGKALYEQDKTINTFDYNNLIYKNFCRGLEYNGKDLVFEDRYKNLYPNNVLLCENNCTINNTDFVNKRVNCLCTYKKDFDFDREEKVDDIFNNPNYYIPTQSPANAEAMKCLFNFTVQQAIAKNFAFYYCFAVAAVEIALALVSSIIGINTITNFIKPILNKIQNKDFRKKSKPKKSIGFKADNIITSTNRPLNNPPRRNNNYNDDDEEIDSEEVKNNNNNNTISEYDFDSNDNKDANYEINIKKSNNKIPKNDNYYKAEFIPQEYNSKFFKSTDKGVIKKIDRSKLPFKIGKDTRYLVEKRKDIEYESNYLDGQYSPTQNILIITDENNTDITNVVKYIKTEKLSDNKLTNKNDLKTGNNKLFGNLNTNYSKYTDKDLITVKKLKSNLVKPKFEEDGISELFDEDSDDMKVDGDNAGLFTLIRREQLFLRLDYKKYLEKKHPNNLAIAISEILDKIYLVKIILFLRKYDIFTHQLSLYLFCHVLLMSLLCGFFTIRVIKKIWGQDGYPGIGFYLIYGLVSNIIIWIIYQIFLYIIDFRDKIKEIVLLQKELKLQESYDYDDNIDERNEKIFKKKYNQIISHIKCIIIIFYVIIFIIIAFCTIYLISFFALYTGTRKKVILSYIYSLIEIIIIKFVYGFSLALLRTASRINKMEKVYKIVYIFDKYIS